MSELKLIPIYTTSGDHAAFLVFPYLFNRSGEWIGWITESKEVYSVQGRYVGRLERGPRILRKRTYDFTKPIQKTPTIPIARIRVPAQVPLPPMMPELTFTDIDVLEDEPDRLPTIDFGEFREDMD